MPNDDRSQDEGRTDGRTFAIGDVHGCARELEVLLERLALQRADTVVFLGDYIDRGPDSRRVIDIVLELGRRCRVVALKGNHESMFLDFLERPESAGAGVFILNGGSSTLASYAGPNGSFEIPESHIRFLYGLKLTYETETHFFVHAGVPNVPLDALDVEANEQSLLWSRQPFLSSQYDWGKTVVHGHTPCTEVENRKNRINLDTGCVYDGKLTALELPSGRIHQVEKGIKREPALFPLDIQHSRTAMRFKGRLPVAAARPGEAPQKFVTLNYNQFGLLIEEVSDLAEPGLKTGDAINGTIGEAGEAQIQFAGVVVRSEGRGERYVYGVRIDRVTNGNDGREWIERPLNPTDE